MKLKNLLPLMVIALLIAPAGCIFSPDDSGDGGVAPPPIKWPSTPEILMENFETIYTGMMINEFEAMLHEEHKTILLPQTLQDWDWADDFYFDKTDKQDGDESKFLIVPLHKMLEQKVKDQKQENMDLGREFKGITTIIADRDIPFRMLAEVVHTAGMAELHDIRFAIVKTTSR